ncbi:MAG: YggS family pyridoxal phosphate-dependent enzyme [bacterium]
MIRDNVKKILEELPRGVELVTVIKGRSVEDVLNAIDGGAKILGVNYLKDINSLYPVIGRRVSWHYIGIARLEKHDLLRRKFLEIFDMIETIDSVELARKLDERCSKIEKVMPVLIEVNIAKEEQKSGIEPERVEDTIKEFVGFRYVKVMGLMTIGPLLDNPEGLRPYFKRMNRLFDHIKGLSLPNVEMRYLSMGMSDSYKVAIDEGANLVRIGTKIFSE